MSSNMSKPGSRPSARDSDVKRADPRERALYALSPAKFVAARDALARQLGAEGKPDAARVKALRRPTIAAWLLNAVVHERWVSPLIRNRANLNISPTA